MCGNGIVDLANGEQCDTSLNGTNICNPTTCLCEPAFPFNATLGSCQGTSTVNIVNAGLDGGALAGILVAVIIVIILIVLGAIFLFRRQKKRQDAVIAALQSLGKVNFEAVSSDVADMMNIDSGDIKLDKELGRGAFGIVYKGSWRGTPVAIKRCSNMNEEQIAEFIGEATFMIKNVRPHPNIVQFLGAALKPEPIIVMEFLAGGALTSVLEDPSILLTLQDQLGLMIGIATGLIHLHHEQIVHRVLRLLLSH